MSKQLFIGLAAEGNSDIRFLHSIVDRTFRKVLYEKCESCVDVDVFPIKGKKQGNTFVEFVESASKEGVEKYGILILAVHSDSDKDSLAERMADKFTPAREHLEKLEDGTYCKIVTPIIPMRMIEAWMLADTDLLREEIGTTMTDRDLGLFRDPESVADPKKLINDAISKAEEEMPKKRRGLSINDLYACVSTKSCGRLL